MSIYKRNKTYWISFTAPNGQRIQRSAKTTNKREAENLYAKLKHDAWQESELGKKAPYSWKDACVRWCKEKNLKKSLSDDLSKIRWFDRYLANKNLNEIDRQFTELLIEIKVNEGASNATVNRYMAFLKSLLKLAIDEWEVLDSMPKFRKLKEPTKRVRYLSDNELRSLLFELPEHSRELAVFCISTGLRMSNATKLKWDEVNINTRICVIDAKNTKTEKPIPVPLNSDAINVLNRQVGKHETYVFTYKGEPVKKVNTKAFRNAVKRAGLKDFRWHDFRHCWATKHAQNGTPMNVLQELGGWQTPAMVARYAHLQTEHLQKHVDSIPAISF